MCRLAPFSPLAADEVALCELEQRVVSEDPTREEIRKAFALEREGVAARLQEACREERKAAEAVGRIERKRRLCSALASRVPL